MRTLRFEINCGEATCAVERGKFCSHFVSTGIGTKPFCLLFQTPLTDHEGWRMRCDECLRAEEINEWKGEQT